MINKCMRSDCAKAKINFFEYFPLHSDSYGPLVQLKSNIDRGRGTGEAGEASASPDIRG